MSKKAEKLTAIPTLTTSQEDYLETIFRLENGGSTDQVRITDIANALGTRLPTVSRTIVKLTELGLVNHKTRGKVQLSDSGRKIAIEFAHRHNDLVEFFCVALGLNPAVAERDTCQIEHGLSSETSQRLHEFMEYVKGLSKADRVVFDRFLQMAGKQKREFSNIPDSLSAGWRG